MTALRLAEHVAGTVNVDAMLETMSPDEFNEWCIKDAIEPIGYHNQMLGLIAWFLHSYLAGDESVPSEHFMPWLRYADKPKHSAKAAGDALALIAAQAQR